MKRALIALAISLSCVAARADTLDGTLVVGVLMPPMTGPHAQHMAATQTTYELQTDDAQRRLLDFAAPPADSLRAGQRIRLETAPGIGVAALSAGSAGVLRVSTLTVLSQAPAPGSGTMAVLAAGAAPAVDERRLVRVVMLFDGAACPADLPAQASQDAGLAAFMWESSYHKVRFTTEEHCESFPGDMPRYPIDPSFGVQSGDCDRGRLGVLLGQRGYIENDPKTHIWFDAPCSFSWGAAPGNAIFGWAGLHELSHNMDMLHSGTADCYGGWGEIPSTLQDCQSEGYGGMPEPMGMGGGDTSVFHKLKAGWLTSDQVQDVKSGGVFTINAVTVAGGLHALRIPGGINTWFDGRSSSFLATYVEYRVRAGLDSGTPPGLYVYWARGLTPFGSMTDTIGYGSMDSGAMLTKPGLSLSVPGTTPENAHIMLISTTATSAVVQVRFGDAPAPPAPPPCSVTAATNLSFKPLTPTSVLLRWTPGANATAQAVTLNGSAQTVAAGAAQFGPVTVAANAQYAWKVSETDGAGCAQETSAQFTMPALYAVPFSPSRGALSLIAKATCSDGRVGQSAAVAAAFAPPRVAFASPTAGATVANAVSVQAVGCSEDGTTRMEFYDGDPAHGGRYLGPMTLSSAAPGAAP